MRAAWLLLLASAAWSYTRDEVLLYVPFDGDTAPLVSHSQQSPEITGEFSYVEGVSSWCITVGAKDTALRYPTAGNMNPNEGTFSIWVQAIDWDWSEKVNRWWIDVSGPTRFIVYHYLHSNSIFFYHMDERRKHPTIVKSPMDWQPGEWKHLAASWKDGRLRLYVNGEKVPEEARVDLGRLGDQISLGAPGKGVADTHLDEFMVFSRALEDVEVRELYLLGHQPPAATISIPKLTAPRLDGRIDADEYASAAAVTGFGDRVTGLLDDEQGVAWLGFDSANLYVAQRWAVPAKVRLQPDLYSFGPVRKEARSRDQGLDEDDCVAVTVRAGGHDYSLRANAIGTIADQREGDTAWNCDVKVAATVDQQAWITEFAVPLKDLGLKPGEPFELLLGRSHRLLRKGSSLWPGGLRFAAATLNGELPGAQLTDLGQPAEGKLDLALAVPGQVPARASVETDSGEVKVARELSAGQRELAVRQVLADTSVTRLKVAVTAGETPLLTTELPFCYPPMLDVRAQVSPSKELLQVLVATRGAASAAPATVTVLPAGAEQPVRTEHAAGGADERRVEVKLTGLPAGKYAARVAIGEGERVLGQAVVPFELRERPEWLGNTIGVPDRVPAPWTPLTYDGDRVSCWGRTVDLSGGLFPRQMISQGADLLRAPVRLVATVGGREAVCENAELRWTERGELAGRWRATGRLAGLKVEVTGWIEFDGMMWFETALSGGPVEVQALRLEVPLAREHSTLLYSGAYQTQNTGLTPAKPWARTFIPCLGLSDGSRGLQWCAQSKRGWHLTADDRAIEVLPSEQANTLTINLIDAPVQVTTRSFAFGLHPTPVKPPLKGRRLIRPYGKGMTPKPNLAFWSTHYSLGCSYPIPVTEGGRKTVATLHGAGIKVHAYTRLCECSVRGPWYEVFRDDWRVHPGPRMDYRPDDPDWGNANPVCPGSASWRDWTVWSFAKMLGELDYDGLYYDVSRPPLCANELHGCGYLDEQGEWQPETQLLANRELQKRMWVMVHQLRPEGLISHHMSGDLYLVTQSFSDIVIDGENYTGLLKDNYYGLLPLDKFRAEFMGHQWGPATAFLPEFSRAQLTDAGKELYQSPAKIPEVRHLAGMIFLHDSLPWPAYSDLTPYATIWAAQDELGWGDEVEFLPYWKNTAVLKPMTDDLVASIYRHGRKALIVLFNNRDTDAQARLSFDLQALKVPAQALRDFETGETYPLSGGVATVPIVKRNFRLLFTQSAEGAAP